MNRLLPTRIGVPVDVDRDAVADLVLGVVGRRQGEAQLLGLVQDRQGDRVVELPLGGRREAAGSARRRSRRPAMMRPTSGRSRVSVPVLSKRTVSTSFISSSARPSLTRMPLLAHRASELSMASGAAMRMPVPKSLLSTATAPAGPIVAMPERADGQGRDHGLVGQPLALVLRGQLVAGRVVEDLADLGRRRLAARHLDRDLDLAGHHHRRGEDPVADPLLGRRRLAGQGVLVDHRHALDDVPVDRHDLAGVDDDDVALLELVERDLDLGRRRGRARRTAAACRRRSAAASWSCPASA